MQWGLDRPAFRRHPVAKQYTDEFRAETVKQVIERGFTVVDVASRIGIPKHALYGWVQAARKTAPTPGATAAPSDSAEIRRLKAELRRVTEERDILKKLPRTLPRGKGEVRVHARERTGVPLGGDVPSAWRAAQRLLRLAAPWRQRS